MITKNAPDGTTRYATLHVDYAKAAGGTKRAIMSTPKVDRVGDSILQMGWDLADFKRNPMMLYDHRSDEPIGIWADLTVGDGALEGTPLFHPEEINPFAGRVAKLVGGGWIRTVSVGFRPLEWEPMPAGGGWLIKRALLLECSIVAIPANPDALIKASDPSKVRAIFSDVHPFSTPESRKLGRNEEAIRKWVAPATDLRLESSANGITRDEVQAMIAKALGSIRDNNNQPTTPEAGNASADVDDAGNDEDETAVAIAELDADTAELEVLIAEIEDGP